MKKLFQAIKKNDLDAVKEILTKKPELISCTAKKPPKSEDGQSLLQVALKNAQYEIANYLIDAGADINFIESSSCENDWRAPVIHDAINAAVMTSRWNINSGNFRVCSTKEASDTTYAILEKMLHLGADVNALDSYGNSGLWRFCLQARQILPAYDAPTKTLKTDRVYTDELKHDLSRIVTLLKTHGMDMNYISPNAAKTASEKYKDELLGELLND